MKKSSPLIAISLIVYFMSLVCYGQDENYSSLLIPAELKKSSNAIVKNAHTEVTIEEVDKLVISYTETITVLNKLGDSYYTKRIGYDNATKILELKAEVYDVFGKKIKTIKERDFKDYSAVDGVTMYSDNRIKYLDYTPNKYPYTIHVNYKIESNSTGFIPRWYPIDRYYFAVQKSSFTINNPKGFVLREHKTNFEKFGVEEVKEENKFTYTIANQKGLDYERHSLALLEIIPSLIIAPNTFSLKGVKGYASNWKEFGIWERENLLKGRQTLPQETKDKVLNLVKGVEDPIEKAKILYKFMQERTRYISVQVGIGGWEPIAANRVDEVGYGDCKGLTNYMKALLDVAGVKSNYTTVYANDKRDVLKDFTSMQGNHVILHIPNGKEDVWLECTNQTIPFNFLGDFTDNRDVMVLTPEGGVIKRTPAYKNEFNLQYTKAKSTLDKEGNLASEVQITTKGIQYDNRYYLENKNFSELEKHYISQVWPYNNGMSVNSAELKNNKDSIFFTEKLNLSLPNYLHSLGKSKILRLNVFNRSGFVPKRYRNRKYPLQINRGFKDVDEHVFVLPEGYKAEGVPNTINLDTKFGSYQLDISINKDGNLVYKRSLLIKEGVYPKEDYKLYRSFRKKISKYDNLKISLINQP